MQSGLLKGFAFLQGTNTVSEDTVNRKGITRLQPKVMPFQTHSQYQFSILCILVQVKKVNNMNTLTFEGDSDDR